MMRRMPAVFPSHPGLLAPLWRRWPQRIAVLPLWIGAMAPDLIDGVINPLRHGELGHSAGHSLFGAVLIDVPFGVLLLAAVRWSVRWRRHSRLGRYLLAVDGDGRMGLAADAAALALGALSHVFFDLISHPRAQLLWPFADDPDWFGSRWSTVWFRFSFPGYPNYPIGPFFIVWMLLTLLGAWMFVRYRPRTHA